MAVCFLRYTAYAQSSKLGSWNIVNLVYRTTTHYYFFTDFQVRAQDVANNLFYYESNAGMGYSVPKKMSVTVAASKNEVFGYPGNFKNVQRKEFRLWEQLSLNNYIGKLRLEHRLRLEQRWINSTYANRLRYRMNAVVPLNAKTLAPHVCYASASEEIFLADKAPHFGQNLFFVGVGYYFSKTFSMQTGYNRYYIYQLTGKGSGKNFIQTTLVFNVDRSNMPHVNRHPSTID